MKFSIKGKYMYILVIVVITLLSVVVVPTYAKFVDDFQTANDVVGMNLDFDISISSIDQYEEIKVSAGSSIQFNVEVFNNTDDLVYYGIWYKMIIPNEMSNDSLIQIGKISGSDVSTSGSIDAGKEIVAGVGVNNYTNGEVTLYIGVNSSDVSVSDIEYLNGKKLITGEVADTNDINVNSITIDGVSSEVLPTSGYYSMTYTCSKESVLTWDSLHRTLTYAKGSYVKDTCDLIFTTSTDYPLLNTMAVGSYVDYSVSYTNPNITEDDVLGYCSNANYRFINDGWRIAYIENNSAYLISTGSILCSCDSSSITCDSSDVSGLIDALNEVAVNYGCSSTYAYGGSCGENSAWSVNATDFQKITGHVLSNHSCYDEYSMFDCGFGNDLIDNGGYYWFATAYDSEANYILYWNPAQRNVLKSDTIQSYGVRPVLRLRTDVAVNGGTGTAGDPYTLTG